MPIEEGFENERLTVVPRRTVSEALARPITRRLVVTDAGYYPKAADHLMRRRGGAEETILIVCADGTGWADMAGVRHHIGAGTALVIPHGIAHAYGASAATPWTIWWCHLRGTDLRELTAEMGARETRPLLPLRHVDRTVTLLDEIVTTLERNHTTASLVSAAGAAWQLMTRMVVDSVLPRPGDPVQRAMHHLAERFDRPIRVSELAALVGLSPSHLSARFRRATGGGVLAYQTALRMTRARRLLDTTAAPVGEISREVGYQDPYYFSRLFRRLHEISPTEYRNRWKG